MPPAGTSRETFESERLAGARFADIFKELPEEVSSSSHGVTIRHKDAQFVFDPDDNAIYVQPLDADGNRYGKPIEITTMPEAVRALEGRGPMDISA